jgi:hypothetical protein
MKTEFDYKYSLTIMHPNGNQTDIPYEKISSLQIKNSSYYDWYGDTQYERYNLIIMVNTIKHVVSGSKEEIQEVFDTIKRHQMESRIRRSKNNEIK